MSYYNSLFSCICLSNLAHHYFYSTCLCLCTVDLLMAYLTPVGLICQPLLSFQLNTPSWSIMRYGELSFVFRISWDQMYYERHIQMFNEPYVNNWIFNIPIAMPKSWFIASLFFSDLSPEWLSNDDSRNRVVDQTIGQPPICPLAIWAMVNFLSTL